MLALQVPALAQPEAPSANSGVSIVDFDFQPDDLTVAVGDTVTWTNTGTFVHTTTSDTAIWSSPDLSHNNTFQFTFNTIGDFAYHCAKHPIQMQGTIHVRYLQYVPLALK